MHQRWLLAVTSVLLTTSPAGAQGVFTSRVEMVPLTVTVTDQAGRYVSGLTERDFAVFEGGVQQSVSFFASERTPVDVALVLDTSASMTSAMPLVREAANGLVRALDSGDRSAVVSVSATVAMPQRFTADRERVAAAIDALRCSGTTAVYDGVYIALREFERERRARSEVRRQVIVLLSDGQDNASHVSADDMAELAKRVGVNIYVVALNDPAAMSRAAGRHLDAQRAAYPIRALARDAGGLVFSPTMATELPAIYRAIAQEIGSQYDLAYTPAKAGGDGAFRRIAVRVARPASVARTRSGYYAARATAQSSREPAQTIQPIQPVRD